MGPARMEAFSDGVIAIIITIMVLEMKAPHDDELRSLLSLGPVFTSYILSFIYVAIYWNNHHHMMHSIRHVNGKVLWANIHLLFWLSLFPFVTAWMGENHFSKWPVVVYGIVACMAGVAYYLLAHSLIKLHGRDSTIGLAIGKDQKGIASVLMYIAGICLCFIHPLLGILLYAIVAMIWFIPDKRIEKRLKPD